MKKYRSGVLKKEGSSEWRCLGVDQEDEARVEAGTSVALVYREGEKERNKCGMRAIPAGEEGAVRSVIKARIGQESNKRT